MMPFLVADIGGTNARFALVTDKVDQHYQLTHIHVLSTANYPTLGDAMRDYLTMTGDIRPQAICLAVAGPVTGDEIRMTNLNWVFSCKAMAKEFGVSQFLVMNDFAAVASACGQLTQEHLTEIVPGAPDPNATRAVFGPGTGLGVAGLVRYHDKWVPIPCEGGHVNLAPATAFEAEVVKAGMKLFGHLSAETFISGPGLVNLYRTLCEVHGATAEPLKPSQITHSALAGESLLAKETLDTFCSFAGSFAGNLALTYGAKGGIYIAGGILPRFHQYLKDSAFGERFHSKGIMSHYVADVPVNLIVHPETPFVGAAAWLEQHL